MQQYFVDYKLTINSLYVLSPEVSYQLKKVLRANNGYEFRLVDSLKNIYLCQYLDGKALVKENLEENNELECDITVILSLIKNDKFDFALQKLTELGVKRIVPYKAYRSVVKEGKGNNKLERFRKIVKEASEQSHRNIIPEITDYIDIEHIDKYKSEINIIAYEKDDCIVNNFKCKSATIVIGPEGGFDSDELMKIKAKGFTSISLGKRILRAETAAIYLSSLIVGANQSITP